MKVFNWDKAKNEKLKRERGISFESIVFLIGRGLLMDEYLHPNQKKHPDQRIYEVWVREYVFLVSFVESEREIFLKTIIPSRKAKRKHMKGRQNHGKKT